VHIATLDHINLTGATKKMTIIDIDELRRTLRVFNIQAVSRETGLSANAIYRFLRGGNRPSFDTVSRLQQYLKDFKQNG
jgi:DNA-binding phage protein